MASYERNAKQNDNEALPCWLSFLKNLQITNDGENVKKREPPYTVGGNVNWCIHYREHFGGSLKK